MELADDSTRRPFRVMRVASLARVEPARAVAGVGSIVQTEQPTAEGIYRLATALSVASSGLTDVAAKDGAGRDAVNLLRQIRGKGYFDSRATAVRLKKDTDLDPLRARDDFKALVADVDMR